tara:strand:+ start:3600 stop:7328 length:3729 start_codon:yes stop_codon:yes gene_type:complete
MFLEARDLVDSLTRGGGGPAERFVHDLILLDAQKEGLALHDIYFDQRTNVGDGGRDVVVNCVSKNGTGLIPKNKSIWSVKSGNDAKKPSLLESEVEEHVKIKALLNDGGVYCYVVIADLTTDQKEALNVKAHEICERNGWKSTNIIFYFNNILTQYARQYASIIPHHFPDRSFILGSGATTAKTWIDQCRRVSDAWLEIENRKSTASLIKEILSGECEQRHLHVTGWSGVGKSRLVAESLDKMDKQSHIIVYQSWIDFNQSFFSAIKSNQITSATVIIDEVDLQSLAEIEQQVNFSKGLRVITIGASERKGYLSRHSTFLDRPCESDIQKIISRKTNQQLDERITLRLAELSGGDIRFAEMFCEFIKDQVAVSEESILEQLYTVSTIVDAHLKKHCSQSEIENIRQSLSVISLLADVGIKNDKSSEVEILSTFTSISRTQIDTDIEKGNNIGICRYLGDLVECFPRPFAVYFFEEFGWPKIKHRLNEFYNELPTERARRSFLRRIEYCSEVKRKEVMQLIAGPFLTEGFEITINKLNNRDVAKTFRTFVENFPSEGLSWLRKIIEKATVGELLELKGMKGFMGPSYGRREIVWLCAHLRCFQDCFSNAEAILYRLALAENEDIGNNSTSEWKQCFWWTLSGTEVPLEQRINILVDKINSANEQNVNLIMAGAIASLQTPMSAMVPPEFIGGRITPPEWKPKTWGQIYKEWDRVIDAVFDLATNGNMNIKNIVVWNIIDNISFFIRGSISDKLKNNILKMEALREEDVVLLRKKIQHLIEFSEDMPEDVKNEVLKWYQDIQPEQLEDKVKNIVSRSSWDNVDRKSQDYSCQKVYDDLATELLGNMPVFINLLPWLLSPKATSSYELGLSLAKAVSPDSEMTKLIEKTVLEGSTDSFVVGYLTGVLRQLSSNGPVWLSTTLNRLLEIHPKNALLLTVLADATNTGWDRLKRIFELNLPDTAVLCSRLFGDHWNSVLKSNDYLTILDYLLNCSNRGDDKAIAVALDLIRMWQFPNNNILDNTMVNSVGHILFKSVENSKGVDLHSWEVCTKWWMKQVPNIAASFLLETLLNFDSIKQKFAETTENILRLFVASYPDLIRNKIAVMLHDKEVRIALSLFVYRNIFEKLGKKRLEEIFEESGVDGVKALARHLPDPDNSEDTDEVAIWFLENHANDTEIFHSYLLGRHSFKVYSGYAFDRAQEVYKRTEPFINSAIPRIREWAQWERDEIDRNSLRDKKSVEEEGRD